MLDPATNPVPRLSRRPDAAGPHGSGRAGGRDGRRRASADVGGARRASADVDDAGGGRRASADIDDVGGRRPTSAEPSSTLFARTTPLTQPTSISAPPMQRGAPARLRTRRRPPVTPTTPSSTFLASTTPPTRPMSSWRAVGRARPVEVTFARPRRDRCRAGGPSGARDPWWSRSRVRDATDVELAGRRARETGGGHVRASATRAMSSWRAVGRARPVVVALVASAARPMSSSTPERRRGPVVRRYGPPPRSGPVVGWWVSCRSRPRTGASGSPPR